jgi:O-antigen/teichoic acid export membrane protein
MTPLRRIVHLSAAFLGSNLARAGIGFGLSLALGRGLGPERFGRWVLCTTWASTLTIVADLGFGVLLTRDGARPDADAGQLVTGALAARLALAVPLGVALYVGAPWITADAESIGGLRLAALVGIAGASYGCFAAIFRAQPRWLPLVLGIETAGLAVQLLGSWWLVAHGFGIAPLLALVAALQLAHIVVAALMWTRVFAARGPFRLSSRAQALALLRRAVPFAASGIVGNLQARIAPLMLGYASTSSELGWFAAASRIGRVARLAPQAIFAGALPVLSHEVARDRREGHRVFRTLDRALLALSLALAAPCILMGGTLLGLIYGASFAAAAPALLWIGVGLVPALTNSGRKIFLVASGGESVVLAWSTVALVVQAAAAALLIPALGGVGAAMSLAISEAVIWLPLRRADTHRAPSDLGPQGADLRTEA